jgi:hypothetical protein
MPLSSQIQHNDSLGDYGHFRSFREGSQLQSDWEISSEMLVEAAQLSPSFDIGVFPPNCRQFIRKKDISHQDSCQRHFFLGGYQIDNSV